MDELIAENEILKAKIGEFEVIMSTQSRNEDELRILYETRVRELSEEN